MGTKNPSHHSVHSMHDNPEPSRKSQFDGGRKSASAGTARKSNDKLRKGETTPKKNFNTRSSKVDKLRVKLTPIEEYEKKFVFHLTDAPGKIVSRLERLMGAYKVQLLDFDWMRNLATRLQGEDSKAWGKKREERRKAEHERYRRLAIDGLMPPTDEMKDVFDHPIYRVNQVTNRLSKLDYSEGLNPSTSEVPPLTLMNPFEKDSSGRIFKKFKGHIEFNGKDEFYYTDLQSRTPNASVTKNVAKSRPNISTRGVQTQETKTNESIMAKNDDSSKSLKKTKSVKIQEPATRPSKKSVNAIQSRPLTANPSSATKSSKSQNSRPATANPSGIKPVISKQSESQAVSKSVPKISAKPSKERPATGTPSKQQWEKVKAVATKSQQRPATANPSINSQVQKTQSGKSVKSKQSSSQKSLSKTKNVTSVSASKSSAVSQRNESNVELSAFKSKKSATASKSKKPVSASASKSSVAQSKSKASKKSLSKPTSSKKLEAKESKVENDEMDGIMDEIKSNDLEITESLAALQRQYSVEEGTDTRYWEPWTAELIDALDVLTVGPEQVVDTLYEMSDQIVGVYDREAAVTDEYVVQLNRQMVMLANQPSQSSHVPSTSASVSNNDAGKTESVMGMKTDGQKSIAPKKSEMATAPSTTSVPSTAPLQRKSEMKK